MPPEQSQPHAEDAPSSSAQQAPEGRSPPRRASGGAAATAGLEAALASVSPSSGVRKKKKGAHAAHPSAKQEPDEVPPNPSAYAASLRAEKGSRSDSAQPQVPGAQTPSACASSAERRLVAADRPPNPPTAAPAPEALLRSQGGSSRQPLQPLPSAQAAEGLSSRVACGSPPFSHTAATEAPPPKFARMPSRTSETGAGVPPALAPSLLLAAFQPPAQQNAFLANQGSTEAEIHFIGELEAGCGFQTSDGVFCEISFEAGNHWLSLCKAAERSHQTQTAYGSVGDVYLWNHPIDLHYAVSSVVGWPRCRVSVWKLTSLGSIENRRLLGRRVDLTDMGVLDARIGERMKLTTRTSGSVKFSVDVIMRNFEFHGFSTSSAFPAASLATPPPPPAALSLPPLPSTPEAVAARPQPPQTPRSPSLASLALYEEAQRSLRGEKLHSARADSGASCWRYAPSERSNLESERGTVATREAKALFRSASRPHGDLAGERKRQ
ncbi:B9 domain-containing protein [Besnoitia besnoiti]|uniref:B9 domain-containing protein 2 n=1 Tax=Besnoitia besnoiti TaxID=94643 RepID=A0A2A9MBV6_BESBE|nr:B9 domain-containing protein [Besnoitia besnoiti]PFH33396.1 B9 domain-containing protein [Besnoitia besnoiti]